VTISSWHLIQSPSDKTGSLSSATTSETQSSIIAAKSQPYLKRAFILATFSLLIRPAQRAGQAGSLCKVMRIPVTVEAFGELVVYVLIVWLIVTLLALHDVLMVLWMTLITCQVMMSCL
jgi:hypothetical protein